MDTVIFKEEELINSIIEMHFPRKKESEVFKQYKNLKSLINTQQPNGKGKDRTLEAKFKNSSDEILENIAEKYNEMRNSVICHSIVQYFKKHPDSLSLFVFTGTVKFSSSIDYPVTGSISIVGSEKSDDFWIDHYIDNDFCFSLVADDEPATDLIYFYTDIDAYKHLDVFISNLKFSHIEYPN